MNGKIKPPTGFWIVAGLFLVWNLLGDAAYLMQSTADLDELAKTDADMAAAFKAMPAWVWSAYAIAVWTATIGSILLLARKKQAIAFYIVSLIGVIVQFGYTLGATDLIAQKGLVAVAAFPVFIVIVGIVQIVYARHAKSLGWIG